MRIFGGKEATFIPIGFVLKIQIQQELLKCFAFSSDGSLLNCKITFVGHLT
jgi:hypothetical protein